jgi:hypothetical protein
MRAVAIFAGMVLGCSGHATQLAALAFGLEAKAAALDKNVVDLRPLLADKALFDRGVAGR